MDLRIPTVERLRQAAVNRDSVTIKRMIKNLENWKTSDDRGESVLHLALTNKANILANQQAIIQTLQCFLDEGLNVNVEDSEGRTVLFSAIEDRLREVIDFLVKSGANVNARDHSGNAIVHFLIDDHFLKYCKGRSELNADREEMNFLHWLLSKDVNVDCKNSDGMTVLHLAIDYQLLHVLPMLINFAKDVDQHVDEDGCTIVEYFFEWNRTMTTRHVDIAKSLLNKGVSVDHVNNRGDTLVHAFLKFCRQLPEITRWMLQRYTKVNARDEAGNTALYITIDNSINSTGQNMKNTVDYVRILLSKGANLYLKNHAGDTPVRLALRSKHATVMKAFSEYDVDFSPFKNPGALLLHEISLGCSNINDKMLAPMVDTLVHAGWDVNADRPYDCFTPLMEACRSRCPAIVQKLIDNGANVNYVEDRNLTRPIHLAAMASLEISEALFKMLAKAGANVNVKTVYGMTALHFVSREGHSASKTLLDLGADVEVRDDCGRSPLYYAVAAGNAEEIRDLLEFGADVNDEDVLRILNEQKIKGLNDDETVDRVMKQWLRLKAVNLSVVVGFANFAKKASLQEFYVECLKEVEILKTHHLDDRATLFDLLCMDVCERYVFIVNNDKLKNLVESSSLENIFPKYHILILAHYRKAVARHPLIEPATRAWYSLTKIDLPDLCVRQILFYLKNEDLRLMAEEDDEINSLKRPSQLKFDEFVKKKRVT